MATNTSLIIQNVGLNFKNVRKKFENAKKLKDLLKKIRNVSKKMKMVVKILIVRKKLSMSKTCLGKFLNARKFQEMSEKSKMLGKLKNAF